MVLFEIEVVAGPLTIFSENRQQVRGQMYVPTNVIAHYGYTVRPALVGVTYTLGYKNL